MQIKHLRICSGTDSETVPVHLEINLFLLTIKKSISKTKMHIFCSAVLLLGGPNSSAA